MRSQFGSRWSRPQSSTLNKSLRDRASAFAANLKQASASDGRIEKDFAESRDLLSVLNHTRIEDILPRISRPIVAVHGDDQALVGSLRQLLGELEALGTQRAGLEAKLKDMRTKENILPQLMNTSPMAVEELYKRELAKYDPVVADVDRNVEAQRIVLQQIVSQTQLFNSTFNIPEYKAELARALKKVETAVGKYKELSSNMHEGLKFYVAMQDAITALKQQCQDFAMTRQIQSRDLIDDLQRQLTGLNLGPQRGPGPAAAPGGDQHSMGQPQGQGQGQAQAQPQPHQPGGKNNMLDQFIGLLGHIAQPNPPPTASQSGPGESNPSPAAPAPPQGGSHTVQHSSSGGSTPGYYHHPPAGAAPPPPPASPYYSTQGSAPPPPQVHPGYYGYQPNPTPQYGVQPGMYAPSPYGAPPPPYGAPPYPQQPQQAPNPYPEYYRPPHYG